MSISGVTRKLAAVVAADVADFSRLMGNDETGTLALLKILQKRVVSPLVDAHHGRLVKEMGDGFLMEFPSAVDAVHCAIEIQAATHDAADAVGQIRLRVGINLGDVIAEGSDIYGEGVNIAARLEAIAPVGGICISEKVFREVEGKVPGEYEDRGTQRLKNIGTPVRIFELSAENTREARVNQAPASRTEAEISEIRERAVRAHEERNWADAHRYFSDLDTCTVLEASELGGYGESTYLIGKDEEARQIWTRMHHRLAEDGKLEAAARIGFWLSLMLLLAGEMSQCSGWLSRSRRLLGGRSDPGPEEGFGRIVSGLMAMGKGQASTASEDFATALALAEKFDDADLLATGLLSQGQLLIQTGDVADGIANLDEAMVTVTTGSVSPALAGIIYCAVILTCHRIFDLRRAREWTRQLDEWCQSQPDLVPYRGQCLIHRSEILQWGGDWIGAFDEIAHARRHLSGKSEAAVGRACYQQGELHRLRGEYGEAEEMYSAAGQNGCEPQPGISLLLLARGQLDAAIAAIRSVVGTAGQQQGPGAGASRAKMLGPFVEICIEAGELEEAQSAAEELRIISTELDAPFLRAATAKAIGAVMLANGDPASALSEFRDAHALWLDMGLPYEGALTRVLLGRACQLMEDYRGAAMHFEAALTTFDNLGAKPALAVLKSHMHPNEGQVGG